jgi:hypothetical protein
MKEVHLFEVLLSEVFLKKRYEHDREKSLKSQEFKLVARTATIRESMILASK